MDTVIVAVAVALAASLVSLWFARGSSKQARHLLYCQQRNDLILAVREARERLVGQAQRLEGLQRRPLAPLDAAHVRSLWTTVNRAVDDLDELRGRAEEFTEDRAGRSATLRAFDQVKAVGMAITRVREDVEAIDARTPREAPAPAHAAALA